MSALRSWLGVRYNRAAFPDPFVNRLSEFKVDKRLAKIIEPVGNLISAVYFDVDGGDEVDHSDGSPYDLKIVLALVVSQRFSEENTLNRRIFSL